MKTFRNTQTVTTGVDPEGGRVGPDPTPLFVPQKRNYRKNEEVREQKEIKQTVIQGRKITNDK